MDAINTASAVPAAAEEVEVPDDAEEAGEGEDMQLDVQQQEQEQGGQGGGGAAAGER